MSEEHLIIGNIRGLHEQLAQLRAERDRYKSQRDEARVDRDRLARDLTELRETARGMADDATRAESRADRYKRQRDAMRRALDQCLLPTGQAGAPGGDQQLALDLWTGQRARIVPTLVLMGICAGRRLERERLDAKGKALQPSLPCRAEGVNQCAYPDSCPPNRCLLREAQDMRNAL